MRCETSNGNLQHKCKTRNSNSVANRVISATNAPAYGRGVKVRLKLEASFFFFSNLAHMSLAFCSGVSGVCSSAVFLLDFLGCGSWGVAGDALGVLGDSAADVGVSSPFLFMGSVGPMLLNKSELNI